MDHIKFASIVLEAFSQPADDVPASESWTVFMIAAGVLIVTSIHDGNIRP